MSRELLELKDGTKIRKDHFIAYENVRSDGMYNMMTEAVFAAGAAKLSMMQYWNVIKHYNECAEKWPEVLS